MADKPTYLAFHHDGKLSTLSTTVVSISKASSFLHDDDDHILFKDVADEDCILITKDTIFHPQGGGQPSDVGTIKSVANASVVFTVKSVRTSVSKAGVVLHLGSFGSSTHPPSFSSSTSTIDTTNGSLSSLFKTADTVVQEIDVEKRRLYSRYHTAGHVLGTAVRHLLQHQIEGFDELKASHFPDSASCEFVGLITGNHKDAIQRKTDEYIAQNMPVEIDWWDKDDFVRHGLQRLLPDEKLLLPGETKFRVVKIVGAEVYPCGGTHVDTTQECGKTTVKKISRQKGTSKVSYTVA